jgi:putative ATP-binding cassette transporter
MNNLGPNMWKRFFALAKPYWNSEKKWQAWGLLSLLVLLLAGYTASNVFFNRQSGEFASALAERDARRFWHSVFVFAGLLVVAVPIYSYYYYVRDKLAIEWRRWLTDKVLARYFADHAFYRLLANPEIDNPDQRIAENVGSFTTQSLNFLLLFASAAFELMAFSKILWSISRLLVLILVAYAATGTLVTVGVFSGRMIKLYFEKLRREADFRFGLLRIRENAESIALYRGEGQENAQVQQRFGWLFDNFIQLIRWSLRLNLFSYTYSFTALVLPTLVIAPRVLSGELEVGRVVQAQGAFASVLGALTIFVDNLENLSYFAAGVGRLDTFIDSLERRDINAGPERSRIALREGDLLHFDDVTLQTPNYERTIVKALTVRVPPGEGLLIAGESGLGKSSLLRAIAGLWSSGTGTLVRPRQEDLLFLPQHAYMILGTVRQQLCYPNVERHVPDEELHDALERVNLGDLTDRFGGFDAELDFEKVLSVGERQRVAFARILLNRPRYVFLDEATSALDHVNEGKLYQLLASTSTTIVSVSHHPALVKYHSQVLELTGGGAWRLCPAKEFQFSSEAE